MSGRRRRGRGHRAVRDSRNRSWFVLRINLQRSRTSSRTIASFHHSLAEIMPPYTQTNRPLQVTTPLGDNVLLVTGFRGSEELSNLFSFEFTLIAENSTTIDFSKLVGNGIALSVATLGEGGATEWRYINGICARFSQGNRNEEFTSYYAEVVPQVWLLTR